MQNCRESLQSRDFLRILWGNGLKDSPICKEEDEWIKKSLFYKRYSMTKKQCFKETGTRLA